MTYKWYIIGSLTKIAGKIRRVFVIGIAGAIKNEGFRDSLSRATVVFEKNMVFTEKTIFDRREKKKETERI